LETRKRRLLDLAVHPTGRVLLTVAKDRRLNMWNLVTAQLIYKQQHPAESQRVAWSPTGAHYALVQDKRVLVFTDQNELVKAFDSDLAVHAAVFSPDGSKIACAGEDKIVYVYCAARRQAPLGGARRTSAASRTSAFSTTTFSSRPARSAMSVFGRCAPASVCSRASSTVASTPSPSQPMVTIMTKVTTTSVEFDGQDDDDDDDDDDDGDDEAAT
jgi:WD40 repeat protein